MKPVHIRVACSFPHPRDEAYAWLTDFDDGDAERAGAVVELRRVVERAKDRVVYEGETEVLGRRAWARTEVKLAPPDAWRADVTAGPRTGSFTTYRLVPSSSSSCALTVDYHFVFPQAARMLLLRVAKPLVKRELEKMWAGYAAAMRVELAAVPQRV